MNVSIFFDVERLAAPRGIQYLSAVPGNEKAPRDGVAGGLI
jgi:hypothetical protein